MASDQRQLVVVLLFFFLLVVTSSAIPISRKLKTVRNQVSVANFHYQEVKERDKNDEGVMKMERLMMKERMDMELADYPGTGENHNHDPTPTGT